MLIAYNEERQLFLPYQYTREDLQRYRQHMKFYCPQCQQPVLLKIGKYNIPHFAHQSKNNCAKLFSERESQLHLQGKMQIFEWLKKIGHIVMLEPYLKKFSQRPDILVMSDQRQVAIEFQCSTISHEKWLLRTAGYKNNDIQVLWLFQTPLKNSTLQGIQKLFISPILQKVIAYTVLGQPYLMTYDAKTARFIYWTNLLHVHGHTFIGKVQDMSINKQHFPFYEPVVITVEEFQLYWQLYKRYCRQYVYQRLLHNYKGVQDAFLRSCYELGFTLTTMPEYVGIPVKASEAIPMFSIEWQTILHHFCRGIQQLPHELNTSEIRLFLREQNIDVTDRAVEAIQNYGAILAKNSQNYFPPDICEHVYAHLFAIATIY
ncbi:competence protein CoiA [Lysinibacillus sp. NPDC047702]|uniref:competence protein CoiA n=1 Tax=unclassified Lysinibacillus TaxID=2636778 RepID=UPI003D04A4E1